MKTCPGCKKRKRCSRCPEQDPVCLDFYHLDPNEKDQAVAEVIRAKGSWASVLKEIKKCEILCANCHRKEHAGT